ncbi:MAG: prepilin-type N-terminal cleavage/methylation domain-containing protein [Sulfurovaceae bacterium]|nr:prepilin-type N-terminal cleavage/methylation domain-containing protein [Sulfurovaceae bacterium]
MISIKNKKIKNAFSLLEVIFVLVILGVVASISSQIIVQVYENYIIQKGVYNVSTKTELAANQIVNRLAYRIQGSTISKDHDQFVLGITTPTEAQHWRKLKEVIAGGDTYTTIEWIGYDNDSFAAEQTPGWSGIADYESIITNRGQFLTPGSNLATTATIVSNLSQNEDGDIQVDLTTTNPAAVVFNQTDGLYANSSKYDPICMGLIPNGLNADAIASSTDCIFSVAQQGTSANILEFVGVSALDSKIITERYKLAWSAYALVPVPNTKTGLHDLVLYSNYQPWRGESYLDATTTRNTILKNISVFKFSENGGTIQFKLCASERIGKDFNVTTCKEKVVIR